MLCRFGYEILYGNNFANSEVSLVRAIVLGQRAGFAIPVVLARTAALLLRGEGFKSSFPTICLTTAVLQARLSFMFATAK